MKIVPVVSLNGWQMSNVVSGNSPLHCLYVAASWLSLISARWSMRMSWKTELALLSSYRYDEKLIQQVVAICILFE